MGDNLIYLFVAFLITWLIMAAYLWSIGRQVRNLRDEVQALENAELPAESPAPAERRQEQVESSQA